MSTGKHLLDELQAQCGKFVLTLLAYVGLSFAPAVAQSIDVAVYHIGGVLESNRPDLPYVQVLDTLAERIDFDVRYRYYHALRAATMFNKSTVSCLFPGSKQANSSQLNTIESFPINIAHAYFMGTPTASTLRVLDRDKPALRIGFIRGNSFGGFIDKLEHHVLIPLNSGANVRKLIAVGRIDLYLGYLPDEQLTITAIPDQPLQYNEDSLFYSQNDSFICEDSPLTRPFIQAVDDTLQEMVDSGELEALLRPLEPDLNSAY